MSWGWVRGEKWQVDGRANRIRFAGGDATRYEPAAEPYLLRDAASVGRLDLMARGGPHAVAGTPVSAEVAHALEGFFAAYGQPLVQTDEESQHPFDVDLDIWRTGLAHVSAAWEVHKALVSTKREPLAALGAERTHSRFTVFKYSLDIRNLDTRFSARVGRRGMLNVWLSKLMWDMWDLPGVQPPARYPYPDPMNEHMFTLELRHRSLLGFIVDRMVGLVAEKGQVRVCEHPLCARDFVLRGRSDQKHCDSNCANAHRVYRLRHKATTESTKEQE